MAAIDGAGHILLVEDDPDHAMLTRQAIDISGAGVTVVTLDDGAVALEYLFREGTYSDRADDPPLAVVLDLKLPRLTGLEVLERIRRNPRTRYVPVVILSSSGWDDDIRSGYALGANSYVRKPLDHEEFLAAVGGMVRYWVAINEPWAAKRSAT